VADLDDGDQGQGVVALAVAGSRQAVADDLAAGGLDRGGAVVGREVVLGREATHVADLAQELGGQNRADAEQLDEGGRRLGDGVPEACFDRGDPPVQGAEVGDQVDGELPAGAGRRGGWSQPAQQGGRGVGIQAALGAAGEQVAQQHMEPIQGPGALTHQVIAAVRQQPQDAGVVLEADLAKPPGPVGGQGDRERVVGVALAAVAGRQ
jgi:hypothetical protein